MTLIAVIFAIVTVAGFCAGATLGGRTGRHLMQQNKWTPLVLALIILAGMGVIAVMTGGEVSDPIRAILATVLGYAGGLVVVSRENIYR